MTGARLLARKLLLTAVVAAALAYPFLVPGTGVLATVESMGVVWICVEDFFIIHNVTTSLKREAAVNPLSSLGFGAALGFGWCRAQIVSLVVARATRTLARGAWRPNLGPAEQAEWSGPAR